MHNMGQSLIWAALFRETIITMFVYKPFTLETNSLKTTFSSCYFLHDIIYIYIWSVWRRTNVNCTTHRKYFASWWANDEWQKMISFQNTEIIQWHSICSWNCFVLEIVLWALCVEHLNDVHISITIISIIVIIIKYYYLFNCN